MMVSVFRYLNVFEININTVVQYTHKKVVSSCNQNQPYNETTTIYLGVTVPYYRL